MKTNAELFNELKDQLDEAESLIGDLANPNKMSETRDTLLRRFEHLREQACSYLEKHRTRIEK